MINKIGKNHIHSIALLWIGLVMVMALGSTFLVAQEPQDLFTDTMYREVSPRFFDATILRTRFVTVNFDLLPTNTLELNLFGGVYFRAILQHQETDALGWTSWVGSIEGIQDGQAVFVFKDNVLVGAISLPDAVYEVQYVTQGIHAIHEVNPSMSPSELPGIPINNLSPSAQLEGPAPLKYATPDSGDTIDVLVAYTQAARDDEGGTAAIQANIILGVTLANTGYNNSGVTQRLRLVYMTEVTYSESSFNWNATLDALQSTSDGVMDELHTLRDTYGADEVVLVVAASDYCGMGYIMQGVSISFAPYAFCLVSCSGTCLTTNYSLAHELGHTMGCHHDRANSSGQQGAYSYSYGYQAPDKTFRTIMAYDCSPTCPRVNYWSNPDKTYSGQPMGVIYTSPSSADNRRTLNNTAYTVANFRQSVVTTPTITVTSPNGGESWTRSSVHSITWSSTGTVGDVKIEYSTNNGSSWTTIIASTANDGSYSWTLPSTTSTTCKVRISEASDGSPTDMSNAVFSIVSGTSNGSKISLNRTRLYFAVNTNGTKTSTQTVLISNSGTGTLSWTATANASWLKVTPASGTQSGVLSVYIQPAGLNVGSYSSSITVSASGASNTPQTITVYLSVIQAGSTQLPFGEFSTPLAGSTVQSSIPVTGWVLDDIEVTSVKIYNGANYIGDAVFVEGARPDVASAYPGYPKNYQAGWGYMLLSYFLPGGGNGSYTLYAIATDAEGNQVSLGEHTITVNNSSAVKPFGAIDTPTQGGLASGSTFINWGWVLTPQPRSIPISGSTINVWVDGVNIGHPTYNLYRADIATLFPGYANSNGAVGYRSINMSSYSNGIHTIQWTASDSGGNSDGIGSRYFTVQNVSSDENSTALAYKEEAKPRWTSDMALSPLDNSKPITVACGYNTNVTPKVMYPDQNGIIAIHIPELERIEIHLQSANSQQTITPLGRLPVGSTWDSQQGILYWQPGPGFLGIYSLPFVYESSNKKPEKLVIEITIEPKFK